MTAFPKGPTRKTLKGRKQRAERTVIQRVRALVSDRDGLCRLANALETLTQCDGLSEWAHLAGFRRSQTRGLPAERRHAMQHTVMLCTRHHGMEERGELRVYAQEPRMGANGSLRFVMNGWECCEQDQ